MTAAERLIAVARAEVGYLEKRSNAQLDSPTGNAGSGNYTKFARDLDKTDVFNGPKNGYAWCAVFAVWCFVKSFGLEASRKMLFLPIKSCAAGVDWLVRYFKDAGRFSTSWPKPGDLVCFLDTDLRSWAHVGIVERVEGGRLYTVEGNTSGASGVVDNGGGVAEKSCALDYARIGGYCRPDWTAVENDFETEDEKMTDTQKEALFREFLERLTGKDIADKLNGYLAPQEAPDWAQGELREAMDLGITDGTQPMRYVPRFEAAIMAKRAAQAAGEGTE